MMNRWQRSLLCIILIMATPLLWAGGSGLNVVVIVNQNSANSVELANYYCERRQVPPQNVLRVNWAGGNVQWTRAQFEATLLNPLLAMLSSRQLTNQIEYVVLSMDFPYRVTHTGAPTESGNNSTTSALFYGFKPDFAVPSYSIPSCNLPASTFNAFAGSEGIFRSTPPSGSNSFLVSMITSSNLVDAKLIVDRGVVSDSSFPTQTVQLAHTTDVLRNIRYHLFDDAIFNTRLRGNYSMQSTNVNSPNSLGLMQGYQSGVQWVNVSTGLFAPGAMADNITSFGGQIFEQQNIPSHHVTAIAFLNAGASGSYGTVVEPCAWLQKFPAPHNYFYQARGFTLAESYYQSVTNPHQGLLVGEPLAAPFAQAPTGSWLGLPPNAVLAGLTNLSLNVASTNPKLPIQKVELFLDGQYLATLTNISPRLNNVLTMTVNGHTMNYNVLAGETIRSVASGVAGVLNQAVNSNITKVSAYARGDRIELRSVDINKRGPQIPVSTSSSMGIASALTTFINPASGNFLDSTAYGVRSYFITNLPAPGDFLQLIAIKTNGQTTTVSVTNTVGGSLADFARSLFNAANTHADLSGPGGVVVEDVNMHEDIPFIYGLDDHSGEFNIRARTPGWPESQVRVRLTGSPIFGIAPAGTNRLDENPADLQPRNHFYVTAGLTNLPLNFVFNSPVHANGFHELTAVVYEGSHVRTQRRITQTVRIQNSGLSATFTSTPASTNVAAEANLTFSVGANTGNISRIELFSTGGPLTNVINQSNAGFSIAGTNLGSGLHPFYAVVTPTAGPGYRTETKWIRLVGLEEPMAVSIGGPLATLQWPTVPGRQYQILSTTNLENPFAVRSSIIASNSSSQWVETNMGAPTRFYRIRTPN